MLFCYFFFLPVLLPADGSGSCAAQGESCQRCLPASPQVLALCRPHQGHPAAGQPSAPARGCPPGDKGLVKGGSCPIGTALQSPFPPALSLPPAAWPGSGSSLSPAPRSAPGAEGRGAGWQPPGCGVTLHAGLRATSPPHPPARLLSLSPPCPLPPGLSSPLPPCLVPGILQQRQEGGCGALTTPRAPQLAQQVEAACTRGLAGGSGACHPDPAGHAARARRGRGCGEGALPRHPAARGARRGLCLGSPGAPSPSAFYTSRPMLLCWVWASVGHFG